MNEREPWYMTNSGVFTGLAIQMAFWLICLFIGAAITMPDGNGVMLGHIVGVFCAFFGFPARLFLDE